MAESYFKDPLLAKWEQALDASIHARNLRVFAPDVDPIDVLAYCRDGAPAETYGRLRALILAELSGARRARERAQQVVTAFADGSGGLDSDLKEGSYEHGELYLARQILEAFDGE